MNIQRATGPGAGVLKYDILTSLSVLGLSRSPGEQTSMMRLMSLITARYNWQGEILAVGQREMAKMWSVNERTVKREIKRLTETGLLICRRPGVKGRVAEYRLNIQRIAELSEECWHLVGPDFADRMRGRFGAGTAKVVSLAAHKTETKPPISDDPWSKVLAEIAKSEPGLVQSWFTKLTFQQVTGDTVHVSAPSMFVARYIEQHLMRRVLEACRQTLGSISQVVIGVETPD